MQGVESEQERVVADDRRRYRRHVGVQAVVEIAGAVWTIVDVSLDGFGARATEVLPRQGDRIAGLIVGSEGDRPFRIEFEGRVVRVDPKSHLVGVQFGDLSDVAVDQLMHVLAMLENEWRARIERLDRQKRMEELRKFAVRLVAVTALGLGAVLVLMWLP